MKKLCLAVLFLGAVAYASQDGNDSPFAAVTPTVHQEMDDVTITVIETWMPGVQALGLDWLNTEDGYIIMASANEDRINRWDASGEALSGYIDLMDTNTSCFGVAAGPSDAIFTSNDWSLTNLFVCASGPTWVDLPANPAGSGGRGMEFDEASGEYWEAGSSGSTYTIYRFVPGGTQNSYVITEPNNQLSGLAVFPYEGNLGVMVTCYNTLNFYFYVFDGSTLSYLATVPCPSVGASSSLGLCYADTRGTFFWSWSGGSGNGLTEIDIDIELGLTSATWGSIKTQF